MGEIQNTEIQTNTIEPELKWKINPGLLYSGFMVLLRKKPKDPFIELQKRIIREIFADITADITGLKRNESQNEEITTFSINQNKLNLILKLLKKIKGIPKISRIDYPRSLVDNKIIFNMVIIFGNYEVAGSKIIEIPAGSVTIIKIDYIENGFEVTMKMSELVKLIKIMQDSATEILKFIAFD